MIGHATLQRNQIAHEAIEGVLKRDINTPPPLRWTITPRQDHSGEPSLYVYVEMPTEADIPQNSKQNQLVAAMLTELESLGDERLPHLHFGPRNREKAELPPDQAQS